jgi:hypothetical protein
MKPPSTVEQPPQSLTLSLRISEVLRKRLEDIRQFTAKRTGGIVSTSEIAKQLLESAREDRLEVVDLLARPTASLLTIRRKGESGQPLSRAGRGMCRARREGSPARTIHSLINIQTTHRAGTCTAMFGTTP